jgi:hypothetical protein
MPRLARDRDRANPLLRLIPRLWRIWKMSLPVASRGQLRERGDSAIAALAVDQARPDSPDLAVLTSWCERLKDGARASREAPVAQAQAARSGFNRRGVVTAPSHAYIHPRSET